MTFDDNGAPLGFEPVQFQASDVHLMESPQSVELYAIVGTWCEADIIEATVKNCFKQGCSKVFLVDNCSPDDTVAVAAAAGAIVADVFSTEFYLEAERIRRMNRLMEYVTWTEQLRSLWWLAIDADEFPRGPGGLTLREFVERLPPNVNLVGTTWIDHYPHTFPQYCAGTHPLETQPFGMTRTDKYCCLGHYKHPLTKCLEGDFSLAQTRGMHFPCASAAKLVVVEPTQTILVHHFPYRDRDTTMRRLRLLCDGQGAEGHRSACDDWHTGGQGASKRYHTFENVYCGRWDEVEVYFSGNVEVKKGVSLSTWQELVPSHCAAFPPVWYERSI